MKALLIIVAGVVAGLTAGLVLKVDAYDLMTSDCRRRADLVRDLRETDKRYHTFGSTSIMEHQQRLDFMCGPRALWGRLERMPE